MVKISLIPFVRRTEKSRLEAELGLYQRKDRALFVAITKDWYLTRCSNCGKKGSSLSAYFITEKFPVECPFCEEMEKLTIQYIPKPYRSEEEEKILGGWTNG